MNTYIQIELPDKTYSFLSTNNIEKIIDRYGHGSRIFTTSGSVYFRNETPDELQDLINSLKKDECLLIKSCNCVSCTPYIFEWNDIVECYHSIKITSKYRIVNSLDKETSNEEIKTSDIASINDMRIQLKVVAIILFFIFFFMTTIIAGLLHFTISSITDIHLQYSHAILLLNSLLSIFITYHIYSIGNNILNFSEKASIRLFNNPYEGQTLLIEEIENTKDNP